MIKKIERYSLVDEAYKRIKEEVLSDKFSEGDLIPSENALSKALSVSRVVIREALSKLRSERIIVTYQGMGSFKSNPKNFLNYSVGQKEVTLEKFKEITEFRGVIENGAILSAVKNASDEELNKVLLCAEKMALQKILSGMEKAISIFSDVRYRSKSIRPFHIHRSAVSR